MAWAGSTRGPATAHRKWRDLRLRILKRDHYTCQVCQGQACGNNNLEVDHIDRHGGDHPSNLQTIGHTPCHVAKTAKEAAAARPKLNRPREAHPGLR